MHLGNTTIIAKVAQDGYEAGLAYAHSDALIIDLEQVVHSAVFYAIKLREELVRSSASNDTITQELASFLYVDSFLRAALLAMNDIKVNSMKTILVGYENESGLYTVLTDKGQLILSCSPYVVASQ